jgi:tetratricopeptide (TPR) repeat protein
MMKYKTPTPSDLKASAEWIKWKFGDKGHTRGALRHVERCLSEIAMYEHYFLLAKANLLGYLERWEDLASLLSYLNKRYPNDPETLCEYATYCRARGKWKDALDILRKAEKEITSDSSWLLEGLYDQKIDCLVALGRTGQAIREAKRVLKKHRRFSMIRADLQQLESGTYKKPTALVDP